MEAAKTEIVDQRTGEVLSPEQTLAKLMTLELAIQRASAVVDTIARSLKEAKEARDNAVAELRAAVRETKALPLFEAQPSDVQ